MVIKDQSKQAVQAPAVSLSRFVKKRVDGSYENVDNKQKFLFNKRLVEAKLQVVFDLARYNDKEQLSLPTVYLAKDILDTIQRMLRFSPKDTELSTQQRSVEALLQATLHSITLAPKFISESGRTQVGGNQILDLLLASAAFKLKYKTDE